MDSEFITFFFDQKQINVSNKQNNIMEYHKIVLTLQPKMLLYSNRLK